MGISPETQTETTSDVLLTTKASAGEGHAEVRKKAPRILATSCPISAQSEKDSCDSHLLIARQIAVLAVA